MDSYKKELHDLKSKDLLRTLRIVESAQGPKVTLEGKELILLCSNDYLGLANHPKVRQAAQRAIDAYGFGSGASRLVSGSMKLHEELEERLAAFKGTESALLFNSGYAANIGVIPAIAGRGDILFSDRLNHASIVDGCLLSRAEIKRYRHADMIELARHLSREHHGDDGQNAKKIVVTDSVFSMDGDIAPLVEIVSLAKQHDAMVMVDEAHGTGVLGEKGKGAVEHLGISPDEIDVHMGTLGKAFGTYGAYIAGSKLLVDYLINKSRSFMYTTSLPPSVAAAALAAMDIIVAEPERRKAVLQHAAFLKEELEGLGFDMLDSQTQIIPILTYESDRACMMMELLLEEGVFVQAIRPPTVPEGMARLRVTVTATHSRNDLEEALYAFEKVGKKVGMI